MQKPDVDQIDGLSPAISIEQKTTSRNPRSTVGTVTEIYDYMRLLWARVGVPYSPATGLPIESQTVSQMVDRILALPEGTRLYLLAPVVRGRKGEYRKELAEFMKKGYQRVKIDGKFYEIAEVPALDKKFTHDIDVVVDRIVVRPDIATRLADLLETGAEARRRAGGGRVRRPSVITSPREGGRAGERVARARRDGRASPAMSETKANAPKPTASATRPPSASCSRKNSPARCPASPFRKSSRGCSRSTIRSAPARNAAGSASSSISTPTSSFPTRSARLRKGAIAPWAKSSSPYYVQTLTALGKHYKFTLDTKWKDLPKKTQDAILYGSGDTEIRFSYDDGVRAYDTKRAVRRRHHQSRAPLPGDRQRLGARGDRALFHRRAVRGLQRLSAQARGAVREDRRQAYRRNLRHVGQRRGALVHRAAAAAERQAERDRRAACSRKSASG